MKQLAKIAFLMLPQRNWVIAYWLTVLVLMVLVAMGLRPVDTTHAVLWGLHLVDFGLSSAQAIENAYLEMMRHVWLLLTLPMTCLVAPRRILDTFRSDFQQFLRFSRSSCLVLEGARVTALAVTLLVVIAPIGIAHAYAVVRPGIGVAATRDGFVSCAVPTVFVTLLLYFLVSLQMPQDIAKGIALLTPFVLSGIAFCLDKQHLKPFTILPCGLPYDVIGWGDPRLRAGIALCCLIVLGRIALVGLGTRFQSRKRD